MPLERDTDEQHAHLSAEWAAAETGSADELTAGRVWGLPELPDGDCWVDIAGVSVILGRPVRTISGWLSRNKPKSHPFPAGHRLLYRLYWPLSEIQAWRAAWQRPPTAASAAEAHDAAEPPATSGASDPGDEDGAVPAGPRELRPGEQLRLTRAQLDDYTLTDASLTGEGGTYRVQIAGVHLGIIARPETRRTGWQARSLHHQPLGTPTRTRQDAVVQLLQHLPGLQIDDA